MSKGKTVKMKFSADMYYVTAKNKEHDLVNPLYKKGEVYDVPAEMVPRWLKRGGEIVGDKVEASTKDEAKAPDQSQESVGTGDDKSDDSADDKEKSDNKPAAQQGRGGRGK